MFFYNSLARLIKLPRGPSTPRGLRRIPVFKARWIELRKTRVIPHSIEPGSSTVYLVTDFVPNCLNGGTTSSPIDVYNSVERVVQASLLGILAEPRIYFIDNSYRSDSKMRC